MNESMIEVSGVWNTKLLPRHYVAELKDGLFVMFPVDPILPVNADKFTAYKGHHPSKCGQLIPAYLYKFYGLKLMVSDQ